MSFSFSLHSLKEPKRKKQSPNTFESILIPLPIPVLYPENSNIELFTKTLPSSYVAILKDKRVYVENEWEAKVLFNCGYFGKGEYSRGVPSLNKSSLDVNSEYNEIENEDYSISMKDIMSLTNERYENRKQWSDLKKNKTNQNDDFNSQFLKEFVHSKVETTKNDLKYCKVNYLDTIGQEQTEFNTSKQYKMFKTQNDPFSFKLKKMPDSLLIENLTLMYEEAFFLCFGLGCLDVLNGNEENPKTLKTNSPEKYYMTIIELWQKFIEFDKDFIFKYAAYHSLRSKGWILKNGLKYGCDFLAYYEGPDRYHASYAIKVKQIDFKSFETNQNENFTQFTALLRVNETASKEFMICYVVYDPNDSFDLSTPMCLKYFNVVEVMVNRWVPNENRDDEKKINKNSRNESDSFLIDNFDDE